MQEVLKYATRLHRLCVNVLACYSLSFLRHIYHSERIMVMCVVPPRFLPSDLQGVCTTSTCAPTMATRDILVTKPEHLTCPDVNWLRCDLCCAIPRWSCLLAPVDCVHALCCTHVPSLCVALMPGALPLNPAMRPVKLANTRCSFVQTC